MKGLHDKSVQAAAMAAFLGLCGTAWTQPLVSSDTPSARVEVDASAIPGGPHCTYTNVDRLPVTMEGGLPTVAGELDGKTFSMVVDTGSQFTKLGMQLAEKMLLNLHHTPFTETDVNGKEMQIYAAHIDHLGLGRYRRRKPVIEVTQIPASSGLVVGADTLLNIYRRDIELSFANREIKFFVPEGCDDSFLGYWNANASAIPLSDLAGDDPRQILTVLVNGHEMTAMIDSGSPNSILDLNAAKRIGLDPKAGEIVQVRSDGSVHRQGKQWQVSLQRFAIGDEIIEHPTIAIADLWGWTPNFPELGFDYYSLLQSGSWIPAVQASPASKYEPPDMILGDDFLQAHRVLLAMSQRKMYFSYVGGRVFAGAVNASAAIAPQS